MIAVFFVLFLIGFQNALFHNGANLPIYLSECGFDKDLIGLFCLLSFPFSCKILWSPVCDHVSIPGFKNSPRKGWLIVALLGMALSFFGMSTYNPALHPWLFSGSLFALSLFAGCFYMVGISYELESIPKSSYSNGSSCLITGYRTGLLYAGAGVLYIAHIASWETSFQTSALISALCACIVFFVREPYNSQETLQVKRKKLSEHTSIIKGFTYEILIMPFQTFIKAGSWQILLAVILLFKVSDHMAKPMEGPFYLELGFDKSDLALAAKTFGFVATVIGAFLAGRLLVNKNPFTAVGVLGLIHTLSEFGCLLHSIVGKSYTLLYLTSGISNFTGGMLITAFISLLWKSCDKYYASLQYAFLWSISSITTNLLAASGGFLAANLSWPTFFLTVSCLGVASSLSLLVILRLRQEGLGPFREIQM